MSIPGLDIESMSFWPALSNKRSVPIWLDVECEVNVATERKLCSSLATSHNINYYQRIIRSLHVSKF